MNDTELDEILDTWKAPEPPASLRGNVRAGYAVRVEKRRPRARLALWAAAFGLGAFLLVLAQAFPQTVKLVAPAYKIPYTVESEYVNYARDGSIDERIDYVSYQRNGEEIVLSQSVPGDPLKTIGMQLVSTTHAYLLQFHRLIFGSGDFEAHTQHAAAFVASGCTLMGVAGHETILGYTTVKVQSAGNGRRATTWMAPDLGCFTMRLVLEKQRPDGTYRVVGEKHATKVTINGRQ
jgi:hypothetical protein